MTALTSDGTVIIVHLSSAVSIPHQCLMTIKVATPPWHLSACMSTNNYDNLHQETNIDNNNNRKLLPYLKVLG